MRGEGRIRPVEGVKKPDNSHKKNGQKETMNSMRSEINSVHILTERRCK